MNIFQKKTEPVEKTITKTSKQIIKTIDTLQNKWHLKKTIEPKYKKKMGSNSIWGYGKYFFKPLFFCPISF